MTRIEIDSYLAGREPVSMAAHAREIEAGGYGIAWTTEAMHDPFLPHVVAAEHTSTLRLGTAIAVAFARTPMTMASVAHDLCRMSGGRFVLGLGTQVRAHVERRFGMPWSQPAARMEEYVAALLAIWDCWNDDAPLDFQGEFYTHSLMAPNFNPGPTGFGRPPIWMAAVGPAMVSAAGRVADGLLCHPLVTPSYLDEVMLPRYVREVTASGRSRSDVTVSLAVLAATGRTEHEVLTSIDSIRFKIAFYASTRAYRSILDHHGLEDLHQALNGLARQGRWDEMGELIDDEVLRTFAVVGEPREVGSQIVRRYGSLADRATVYEVDDQGRLRTDERVLGSPEAHRALMDGVTSAI